MNYREVFFFFRNEGSKTLEQAAQRNWVCSIIGSVEGWVGWGFEWLDLLEDFPVGLDDLQKYFSTPNHLDVRFNCIHRWPELFH